MKKLQHLLLLVMCVLFATSAHAQEDYTMPKKDGFIAEKIVDGSLTFYDMGGPSGSVPSYYAGYVRFVPANAGDQLVITFEELNLSGVATLYIYDGDAEFTSYSSSIKDDYLAAISGSTAGQSYTATSGQLSVLYHGKGSASGAGWKATITAVSPKDMEYVSTSAIQNLNAVNRGAHNQVIFGAQVVTDGGSNPLTLNNLTIDCSALTASTQVSNVRLYSNSVKADNLVATAATVGDALQVSDVQLKSKENNFYVVADVLPDASGEVPSLTISNVVVAGESRTPQATQSSPLAINNVVLMPAQATTFTVSDDIEFYDDGGKDGKIGDKFVGQVTFVPATAGNKVKIDFTKLKIFNTSSVGLNDVLKVYNGTSASEENLLATLLTENSKVVKSTAEDGALTVTLTSTTGVPADGWEAVVSQFLPGDMSFKSVSASASSDATIVAGETDARFITVNVVTDNQSNPLSLTAMTVALGENVALKSLSKVKVYYLGETNDFAAKTLFGEIDAIQNRMSITGNTQLVEGNNYFAIAADVAAQVLNDEVVTLTLENVTVADNQQAPATAVSASRKVFNQCSATQGSHAHTIWGEWVFTDTKSSLTPSKYEYENADYIVTFTPADANAKAMLDFSAFDVTYSSSSYGVKAIFEVYSGSTVDADNLLWKLSSSEEATKGPGKKLYSTAADGSITVKFNPNTTSSYYAATGWTATVSPFIDHDMTIKAVEVSQASSDNIMPGATKQKLLKVNVATEGTLSQRTLKSIKLNLKGSQALVDTVCILSSGDVDDFAAATIVGSSTALDNEVVDVATNLTLAPEDNFLWVAVDVKADALSDAVIDASVVSISCDDKTTDVANGDPDGARTVKNQIILQAGDNGVVTVTRSVILFDDGGPDENFSSGFDGVIRFVPGIDDALITINSNSFGTGAAKFYLYSGSEETTDNLLGTTSYFSGANGPVNLVSTAADGSITIRFKSNTYSTTTAGFEVEIGVRERAHFSVDSVTATAASQRATVVRGNKNAELVHVKVDVVGDKTPLSVDSFRFSTTGTTSASDIAAAKLYYTATAQSYGMGTLLATATPSNGEIVLTPQEPFSLDCNGTHNFWLVVEVAADAQADNTIAATLQSLTIGGNEVAADRISSTAASRTIGTGLSGEFIIGASSNAQYATIAAAVEALAGGVEGAVTFLLEDGTYAENVKIANIEGSSAEHPIKFASLSGNKDQVVITGAGYSEPSYGEMKYGMFVVEHTPYVTIENISFIPTSQAYPSAVHIYNQSRYFTLKNCVVKAETVTSGYSGMNLVKAESINEEGKNNDYMTIEGCELEGGYIALYLGGTSYVALTKEIGLTVKNNTILDSGSKGVYVCDEMDCTINGNRITSTKTQKTNYSSIDISRCRGALVVSNNVCINTQAYYSNGIYIRSTTQGGDDVPAMVYNNVVSVSNSPTTSTSALYIATDTRNMRVLYNTVLVSGEAGYTFYTGGSNRDLKNMVVKNNLFQNFTSSPAMYLNSVDHMTSFGMSNNAYYAQSGTLVKDLATSLEDYSSITGDTTSVSEKAEFVSSLDLRLASAGNLRNAAPIAEVQVDITGAARDAEHPTFGAYEYAEIAADVPEIAEGYPVAADITDSSFAVKTKWSVGGTLYYIIKKASEQAPTTDELLAAASIACSEGVEVKTAFDNLEQQTAYRVYFLVVSGLGVQSAVIATADITTARTIAPLALELPSIYDLVEVGSSTTIAPVVTGGDAPYTCQWLDQMHNVVGSELELTITPEKTSQYFFSVTSADGQTLSAKTVVYVIGNTAMATFDDNYLDANSWWNGDVDSGDTFYSGSFAFNNNKMTEWMYWESFAYANCSSNAFVTMNDQYNSAPGGGVAGSAGYAVAYCGYYSTPTIEVTNSYDGTTINGTFITNSAWAVQSMTAGDSYTKAFTTGDFYKVTFTGYNGDEVTASVDCYLADYTSQNEADHFILDTWKWVDLSGLGNVTKVTLSTVASQSGVPTYLCLDNFGGDMASSVDASTMGGNVRIYPVPAVDVLHIDGVEEGAQARIFTLNGVLVSRATLDSTHSIDVSTLVSGAYIITIDTANGIVKKQFIKK